MAPRPLWLVFVFCSVFVFCQLVSASAASKKLDHDSSTKPITVQNDFQVVIDSDNAIQLQRRNGQPMEERSITSYDDGLSDFSMFHTQNNHDYDHESKLNDLNHAIDLQRIKPDNSNSELLNHFKPIEPRVPTSTSSPLPPPSSLFESSFSKSEDKSVTEKPVKASSESVNPLSKFFSSPNTEPTNIFANQNVFLPKPMSAHRHLKSLPSFSKMPDYLFKQLSNNELSDSSPSFSEDTPSYAPMKPLVVPTGSRVHTIKYMDYPETVVSNTVAVAPVHSSSSSYSPPAPPSSPSSSSSHSSSSKYNELSDSDVNSKPYEPVIELTGSRPILPIVFNFRTSSAPAIAKAKLRKLYADDMRKSKGKPKTKYFQSEEPPQYSREIIHKPIQMKPIRKTYTPTVHYDDDYSIPLSDSQPPSTPASPFYPFKMPKYSSVQYADNGFNYMPSSAAVAAAAAAANGGNINKFNYPLYTPFAALPQSPIYVPDTAPPTSYSQSGPSSYLSSYFYPLQSSQPSYNHHPSTNYPSSTLSPSYLAEQTFFPNRYSTFHSPVAESTRYFTQAFPFVDAEYVNLGAFNRYK